MEMGTFGAAGALLALTGTRHPDPAGILGHQPNAGEQLGSEELLSSQHISMCSGLKPNTAEPAAVCSSLPLWLRVPDSSTASGRDCKKKKTAPVAAL